MGILCNDGLVLMLSSSNIGQIAQCACCESYHVTIGNITMRMERKHLLNLTQMIIDALEVKANSQSYYQDYSMRNQA